MADRCEGLRARAFCRGVEVGEIRQLRRSPEASSKNPIEPVPLEELKRRSVLYRGDAPSSTFRDNLMGFTPEPVKVSQPSRSDQGSSVDWVDVVGWCLSVGAGVASGFLIEKGFREDDALLAATGDALATSVLVWGIMEASFRGTGSPHQSRGARLGIALGTGAVTGVAVWLGMKYNGFDFSLEGKTFADDKKPFYIPFLPPRRQVEYVPVIPDIKIIRGMANTFKNPTSEWGP